jgi:eukaryotic-like serine/threonine-protein kinase
MLKQGALIDGRYKIVKALAGGGFGETYLAEDIKLYDKKCVVKHLSPSGKNDAYLEEAKRRFRAESKQLHQLGNLDQVPELLAFVEERGELYIVQEWVDGKDLRGEIRSGQKMSEAQVIRLLQEILTVLQIVHRVKVVHRDLKPANIMRRRSDRKLVLIDFGAVKELADSVFVQNPHQKSYGVYTAGYAAPEQMNGHPQLASDVYAVGAIAVQALTGVAPSKLYDGMRGELVWRNQVTVSEKFGAVLERMLQDKAIDRYPDAKSALMALEEIMRPEVVVPPRGRSPEIKRQAPSPTIAPSPTEVQAKPKLPFSRRRFLQWTGFGVVAVGSGVAVNLFSANSRKNQPMTIPRLPSLRPDLEDFQFETVQLNDRGVIQTRQTLSSKRFIQKIDGNIQLEMVRIPTGKFLMGSPESEKDRNNDEGPQHEVSVAGFFMAQTPVTQAHWRSVAKLPKVKIDLNAEPSNFKGDNRPVEKVSWWEAVEFCDRLSKYASLEFRLPSEAEWEYACRSNTKTPFYFGETITTDVANYCGTDLGPGKNYLGNYGNGPKGKYIKQTTDVMSYPANGWGLYDMHGNVREWCGDHWRGNYQGAPIDGSAWLTDKKDAIRSLRGGSWGSVPRYCRSANRVYFGPADRDYILGFRVVCRLPA